VTQNKNILLIILAIILVLKFALLPIIEWQNQSINTLQIVNKKLNKSLSFINELPKLEEQKQRLINSLAQLKSEVDTYQDVSRYQLEKQREVEKIFAMHNIVIKSFNWQDIIKLNNGTQLKLMVKYSGKLKDFLSLHMDISKFNRSTTVSNLGLNIRGQDDKSLGVISGSIVLVFHPEETINDNL